MWLRERAYWIALSLLRYAARGTGHHYQTRLVGHVHDDTCGLFV
jgi:hypothetical protein